MVRSLFLAGVVFAAGCSTVDQPPSDGPPAGAAVAASSASAPLAVPPDPDRRAFVYRLLNPEASGIEQVFTDGHATYCTFAGPLPPTLLIFDDEGQALRYEQIGRYAVINGVHDGILLRTSTSYSYAAPTDPTRFTALRSAGNALLPPDLAAQRAVILQLQRQVPITERKPDPTRPARRPAAAIPINQQLDQSQSQVDGSPVRVIRIYFGMGRTDLQLSAEAQAALRQLAAPARAITLRAGTDNTGHAAGNQRILLARITATRALLIRMGVPASAITIDPTPASYLGDNATTAGRALNRRVEITLPFITTGQPAVPVAGVSPGVPRQ